MKYTLLYLSGLLLLLVPEVLRIYFIMPFPGSQYKETLDAAYFFHQYIPGFRIAGLLLVYFPMVQYFRHGSKLKKAGVMIPLILYGCIFYFFNFKFTADHIFYQPEVKSLVPVSRNAVDLNRLILGVSLDGSSKAYPIEIIGYHHQVRDTVGNFPVMITYCTVCRTGRVYSPMINGKDARFRLVGMDHFNAMFEDAETGSWWRQVNGESVEGPLKGTWLHEILSEQMTLKKWISLHPETLILQPDPKFTKHYKGLEGYDEGTIQNSLEYTDTVPWQRKSWVIGIQIGNESKAYDWRQLLKMRIIEDTIDHHGVLITMDPDSASYRSFSRTIDGETLSFRRAGDFLLDEKTSSKWTTDGACIEGAMTGKRLEPVKSSQEFWHSWKQFHPGTLTYK